MFAYCWVGLPGFGSRCRHGLSLCFRTVVHFVLFPTRLLHLEGIVISMVPNYISQHNILCDRWELPNHFPGNAYERKTRITTVR